jgi:hypothetical protein
MLHIAINTVLVKIPIINQSIIWVYTILSESISCLRFSTWHRPLKFPLGPDVGAGSDDHQTIPIIGIGNILLGVY